MKHLLFVPLCFLALLCLIGGCTSTPEATASRAPPTSTESPSATTVKVPAGEATVLFHDRGQVVYSYAYDPDDLEAAHLCLWLPDQGTALLDQTDEQVRWFTNAVISADLQQVVYTRYLRQSDLVEIWAVGLDGSNQQRLVASETFVRLGEGFARAIPMQMLALPGGYVIFNNSEFGYKTDSLNDLHLVELNNGELTTLLPAGEGGQLSLSEDNEYVLIWRPGDTLALHTTTRQIQPAPPVLLTPDAGQPPTATTTLPSLQDCTP